ncbi:putative glutathione-dependent formaldehyde-activating gfa protein [Phaeoacremonium minimum UCRPA7]|uniref:Putative glutathione-dependent formaldehyde-activating gfa protein n=1 Tax=Phaeoacremonium minimum (strain UCR-PA7) TaxID=1286976 RepID=R8BQ57_PHAM7|nr:putative glutathione-dependent formaldehyde-activating gfa protein [Phaeoacremonium minimum UCRPA7]EOO01487.1 putative glutathione-dependent formaldehyde-activating gfa protein [Phaeoacremonium minimum UCRPA7]
MAEESPKTYHGNCHCGAFIFELTSPEIKTVFECNCSICSKKGYAWLFPGADNFKPVKGDVKDLTEYTFNDGNYIHRFCATCGTPVMAFSKIFPPEKNTAVNARAIQDLDLWSLGSHGFDGAALDPKYKPPAYTGPEPSAEIDGAKTYHGSCHCGDVKVAVKVKPLDTWRREVEEERVIDCNCSICQRGAYVWIYPSKEQVAIEGEENMTNYSFANKIGRKGFCKKCGVHIVNDVNMPPDGQEIEPWRERFMKVRPITLRILNDFDYKVLQDRTRKEDGWKDLEPQYVNP